MAILALIELACIKMDQKKLITNFSCNDNLNYQVIHDVEEPYSKSQVGGKQW